jgi:signal transduction histidine kinase
MAGKIENRRGPALRGITPGNRTETREAPPAGKGIRTGGKTNLYDLQVLCRELETELQILLANPSIQPETLPPLVSERAVELTGAMKRILESLRLLGSYTPAQVPADSDPAELLARQVRNTGRQLGVSTTFTTRGNLRTIGITTTQAVLRLFALIAAGVRSYGVASTLHVALATDGAGKLILEVVDDGGGITERRIADSQSLSLLLLHERTRLAGGECVVRDIGTIGTSYSIILPVMPERSH